MPIPDLNGDGLLPEGDHDCTLDEVKSRFGSFRTTDHRVRLFDQLLDYIGEVERAAIATAVVIDGSFVTAEEKPNDVDVLIILRQDVDLTGDLPPYRSNPITHQYVKKHYSIDFFWAFEGQPETMIDIFRRVKGKPGATKGYLRLKV